MNYLNDLNQAQKDAVLHESGPLLILAGAGAGKTRVITYRIAHLIRNGIAPGNILAVTFTNKASKEMAERINELLTTHADFSLPVGRQGRPFVKTFHSLGVHIIKDNAELLGLPKRFTILDSADSKKIIRDAIITIGEDPKEHEPRKIQSIISKQKGEMISVAEFETGNHKYNYTGEVVGKVWKIYENKLKGEGALDFDDLLIKSVEILERNPEVLKKYQDLWQHIHIDEYQDTNEVQYRMTKMLAHKHKNICVVGDIDQNIYSWRGATIKNIMNFEKDYPDAREIVLEENYRSTQNILQAANEIITKNKRRKEKNLFTKNGAGEKVAVYQGIDEYDEAKFIARKSVEFIKNGTAPDEIAVLYRANFQSRVLEEIFLEQNIPHQVIGTRFFDRKEVKDVLSYIKSAMNDRDFTNMSRVINVPKRGIGEKTLEKIAAGQESELAPSMQAKFYAFKKFLAEIREEIKTKKPHEIITLVVKKSGMEDELKKEGEEGAERLENIRELASLAKKYEEMPADEAIEKMLEDVSLSSDQDELDKNNGGVKLMTVHAAKGLEFDYVFVTGLEEGLFPHKKFDDGKTDDEEERRLFYVAVTRARKKLHLTYASFRTIYGSKEVNSPSEFLGDISDNIVENVSWGSDESRPKSGRREFLIDF